MVLYNSLYNVLGIAPTVILLFVLILAWDAVWKGIALWKSGKNKQLVWFIFIFIFNTIGILPIIYLLFFQKRERHVRHARRRRRR